MTHTKEISKKTQEILAINSKWFAIRDLAEQLMELENDTVDNILETVKCLIVIKQSKNQTK